MADALLRAAKGEEGEAVLKWSALSSTRLSFEAAAYAAAFCFSVVAAPLTARLKYC